MVRSGVFRPVQLYGVRKENNYTTPPKPEVKKRGQQLFEGRSKVDVRFLAGGCLPCDVPPGTVEGSEGKSVF
jgi:hypothetical protein